MKTMYALFSSALAAIILTLLALISTACTRQPALTTAEEPLPVVPTTLVYSIDAPDGFDRHAIAHSKPADHTAETVKLDGKETDLSLSDAFAENEWKEEGSLGLTDSFAENEWKEDNSPDFTDVPAGNEPPSLDDSAAFADTEWHLAVSLTEPDMTDRSAEISVLKAVTCHLVEARTPVDESSFFQAENGRVWLYTQVALPAGTMGLIQHVWKHEGEVKHRMDLLVEGPTYRTASYTTINDKLVGDWTVEVTTENGEVLEVVEFRVE